MKQHTIAKYLVAAALLGGSSLALSAQALTVEDYCDIKKSSPARIKEMRPLDGGQEYAAISDDGRSIDRYSYRTGKKVGTLFSLDAIKGDLKIEAFDGYTISANGRAMLLWNNVEKLYRRSFYADFYVYDVMRGTMKKVGCLLYTSDAADD